MKRRHLDGAGVFFTVKILCASANYAGSRGGSAVRKGKGSLFCIGISLIAAVLIISYPIAVPLEVEAEAVRSGELVQTYLISGTVCEEQYPCITPLGGRISQVLAKPGTFVTEGELLFKLDTTAQEQALAELYELRFACAAASSALEPITAAYTAQAEQEWFALENQLLSLVEASCIRAPYEGVMSAVYVKEGETVTETAVLGLVGCNDLQIQSEVMTTALISNTPEKAWIVSENQQLVPLVLKSRLPSEPTQKLVFEFADKKDQAMFRHGETVCLEVVETVVKADALIPLAAFDAQNDVWCIRDNKATRKQAQMGECSRTHASADAEWANETVILQPDRYALKEGMEVRIKH